jgi:hypothetical protein
VLQVLQALLLLLQSLVASARRRGARPTAL